MKQYHETDIDLKLILAFVQPSDFLCIWMKTRIELLKK